MWLKIYIIDDQLICEYQKPNEGETKYLLFLILLLFDY